MTEKGKKPGAEAASADPLSATGMFLNAFRTQPEEPAEQPLEGPAKGPAKPEPPGEFTQMFHKLEPPPPLPQARSTNTPQRDTGEFTRMFVAAATSHDLRPVSATPGPAPFAPPPTPKLRGFLRRASRTQPLPKAASLSSSALLLLPRCRLRFRPSRLYPSQLLRPWSLSGRKA